MTKAFSVKKYGDRGAFKRAVQARSELLALVEDQPVFSSRKIILA